MTLPRRVLVKVVMYTVTSRNKYDLEDIHGYCDFDAKEIFVCPHAPNRRETLLHEVLHAIFYEYKIKRSDRTWHAEATIDPLASALIEVMDANPKFTAYIGQV